MLPQASNHVYSVMVNSHTCEEGVGENPSERERERGNDSIQSKHNVMERKKAGSCLGWNPQGSLA